MSKLEKLAQIFTAKGVGRMVRPVAARVIERTIVTRADALAEVIRGNRECFPELMVAHNEAEVLFKEVMQELWNAIASIVEVIQRQNGELDLDEIVQASITELQGHEVHDAYVLQRVQGLESPFDKMVLRYAVCNKQRFLALCVFLDREGIDNLNDLLKRSPEIAASISAETEKILDGILTEEESPIIWRIVQLALELNRVTRKRGKNVQSLAG